MTKTRLSYIESDYKKFTSYYQQYLAKYKRKLSPQSDYTEPNTSCDTYAYTRASDTKEEYNTLYNQRYGQLTPQDPWLTVISATCHHYTLAGTYQRELHGILLTVFVVITPHRIHEWYIDNDPVTPVYIGRVPAWRTYYHWWDVKSSVAVTTDDERLIDEQYKEDNKND